MPNARRPSAIPRHDDPAHDHYHDHDLGLAHDLSVLAAQRARRRQALRWLAGAGAGAGVGFGTLALLGCGGGGDAGSSTATTTGSGTTTGTSTGTTTGTTTGSTGTTTGTSTTTPTTTTSCTVIPEETAGPYPGDGSNTANGSIANVLGASGIVRGDIRSSVGGLSGTAEGVPLAITLTLVNTGAGCASLAGYAIYLWHCDRDGNYSMYSSGVTNQNYLRGVQATDANGQVTFTTIFPGCYSGRMPHVHFEIYRSLATATNSTSKLKTSQLAFPTDVCSTVYNGASGYSASVANLARISFATDNVFSDGVSTQLASVGGSVSAGYTANLTVGIVA